MRLYGEKAISLAPPGEGGERREGEGEEGKREEGEGREGEERGRNIMISYDMSCVPE